MYKHPCIKLRLRNDNHFKNIIGEIISLSKGLEKKYYVRKKMRSDRARTNFDIYHLNRKATKTFPPVKSSFETD